MKKPKAPKEDASTIALRQQQVLDLSKLDEEENLRVKQLLVGQRGGRFFRGSPAMRAKPGDRPGASAGTGAGSASTGGFAPGLAASLTRSYKKGLYEPLN